jgi:hypothetical protein
MLGPQALFKQHGQSGALVSENLPHFAGVADEVSFLKGVYTISLIMRPLSCLYTPGLRVLEDPA